MIADQEEFVAARARRTGSGTRAIPTGALSYTAFMAPGILAQSVLSRS